MGVGGVLGDSGEVLGGISLITWVGVGGVLEDSGEVLGGISLVKKAKEPSIDEHLTLVFHGKRILTTPSGGKSPFFGLL